MAKTAVKAANKSRAAKVKEHAKKTKERAAKIRDTNAMYLSEKDNPILLDLMAKLKTFQAYHNKIAQDGIGARPTGHKLVDGSAEVETIYLTNDQRAGHLDKAAGLQELADYVDRMLTVKPIVSKESK